MFFVKTGRECPLIQKSICYYCGKRGHHNQTICPEKFGDKQKEKVENVFVTSEVSERSPYNTKHGHLNQPVNSTSVNFEQVLAAYGERVLLQTATVPIQRVDGSEKTLLKFFWIVLVITLS